MPTDRDRSLVEHLATRVMGWIPIPDEPGCYWWLEGTRGVRVSLDQNDAEWAIYWDPLAETTLGRGQAVEVWERARGMGHILELTNIGDAWVARLITSSDGAVSDSAPRVICEAIYRATGGSEECIQISDKEEV